MTKQVKTVSSFNFKKKSIKNLVFSCLLLVLSILMIVFTKTAMDAFKEFVAQEHEEVPDPMTIMKPMIPFMIVMIVIMVLGICKFVYDINIARYAKQSKTFGPKILTILTFAITPTAWMLCFGIGGGIAGNKYATIFTHTDGSMTPDEFNVIFDGISQAVTIVCIIYIVIVAWNIVLNILNIIANKKK